MPRKYVRKTLRATSYTQDDLAAAIATIKLKELTLYAASKRYNIPIATLHNRLNEKTGIKSKTLGRPPVFSEEIEINLANGLKTLEKWGFGLSRKEVILLVKRYVQLNNVNTPFKDGVPGPDWFTNFCKRNGLSLKKAQPIEYSRRKNTDPFIIHEYFNLLQSTLRELNLENRPDLIWNLDETSVCLDPSKTKVVGKRGAPSSRTTHGTGKDNITVLTAISANAKKISPLIIFKGKFVWDSWVAKTEIKYDFELSYAASPKGWMDTQIFYNYIEKVFIPGLGNERPVLLIYDGHGSHVDLNVVDLAIRNNITIIKLPPHTSHILQPLDVAVFKSFKSRWDAKLVEWQRKNTGVKVPKRVFSELFGETWNDTTDNIIKSGFKKAGIYPFNSGVVPVDKYDPRAYKRWEEAQKNNFESLPPQSQYLPVEDTQNTLRLQDDSQFSHLDFQDFQDKDVQLQVPMSQTPVPLKDLCINAINILMYDNLLFYFQNTSIPEDTESIQLLAEVSKHQEQAKKFVANNEEELPACLTSNNVITENVATSKTTLQRQNSNINILSNEVVSFEELLLETVKQSPRHETKIKKRRVALGAEVITESMKNRISDRTTQNILKTKIVIPKRKTAKDSKIGNSKLDKTTKNILDIKKKTPKDSKVLKIHLEENDDSKKTKKKQYHKKCEVKEKSQQQKKAPKNVQRKRKPLLYSDTESSETEMEVETIESDDSNYNNMDEFIDNYLKQEGEDQENINPCIDACLTLNEVIYYNNDNSRKLKNDDWVVVQFATKKNVKHFVGTILTFEEEIPIVKFARKIKQSKSDTVTSFTYPIVEDISPIKHVEDIVCILPEPFITRRGQINFEVDDLKKYNIQ